MKNKLSTLVLIFATITTLFAQTPEAFKYQAIIRDGSGGIIVNQPVSFEISILQDSETGTVVYTETFSVTTNQFGLVNLIIGEGTTVDDFSTIDWVSTSHYLKVSIDEAGGTNYTELSVSKFVSVPYSLIAKNVQEKQIVNFNNDTLYLSDGGQVYLGEYESLWTAHDTTIFYNKGFVGVGTENPQGKFVVQGDTISSDTLPLFEVKNKTGQTIFAVYDGGVRIYVDDNELKANNNKGGFAVGGYRIDKGVTNEYMRISPDSIRMYISEDNNVNKANNNKGGFAVGGYRIDKTPASYYMNIYGSDTTYTLDSSEARILWYPLKEAFLVGRVILEHPDSVGLNSFATGFESKAIGDYSQAMGRSVVASAEFSTAIGHLARADGFNSYAFGNRVTASDTGSFAFGFESVASGNGSFVFGAKDTASAFAAMALGYSNNARGLASLALGAFSSANDTLSVAMGYNTVSEGIASVAMGDQTYASGNSSLATGYSTVASGELSTAMGSNTVASGVSSIAMGHNSHATSYHAIAMGDSTYATNHDALAMGYKTRAEGYFSTSMGNMTLAHGIASFAVGDETTANGNASIAMGTHTTANGNASVAMGINTRAIGDASLAFGNTTIANGESSVAIGHNSIADGSVSAAYGVSTRSSAFGSFVIGSYNQVFSAVNSTALNSELFVIGNGIIGTPHNAFTVLKGGFIGINTNTPDKLLTVVGDARVTGDIFYGPIGMPTTYTKADYVFLPEYKLFDIDDIESFIKTNGHLPWVTAAKDEKEGVNMTRMGFETLEAVENQQLQIIKLKKENEELLDRIERLERIILKDKNK